MLEDLRKASNRTVGIKQTIKAIEAKKVSKVFVAGDVDDFVARKIRDCCKKHNISFIVVDSMKELGEACGIEVGAATAAILK